jgi:hypothetical protein
MEGGFHNLEGSDYLGILMYYRNKYCLYMVKKYFEN